MHSEKHTGGINITNMRESRGTKAFRLFFEQYYDRFFRIAFYYLKTEEWAQEVVLDVFYKLWTQRESLSTINQFDNYCFILVKNASLNYLAKEERRNSIETTAVTGAIIPESSPEDSYLDEELIQTYLEALDQLPPRCREVFIGVREENKSYAEVAAELNISPKTVDAQLQKAISKLKNSIQAYLKGKE